MSQTTSALLRNWSAPIAVMAAMLLGRSAIDPWLGNQHPLGLLFGGVALVVWVAGWRPAVLAAALGFIGASFWFIEPRGTLIPRGLISVFCFTAYVISCAVIIIFGEGMRRARRRAELITAQLRRSEEDLKESARRKDEFLAMLAHELRNPLAPMLNSLEYLRLHESGDPQVAEARTSLERHTQHMARLVDDLLDVARITRGHISLQKQSVALTTIIEAAVQSVAGMIRAAGHTLQVTLVPHPVHVDADADRLTQVLVNLLNNAAKFTPDGGNIAVGTRIIGREVEISIRDTGIGIEPTMLAEVFEMFTQVESSWERARGGLGIGLALARQLVTLHGGRLEARSAGLSKGSEFIVSLSLAASAPPATVASCETCDSEPRRILIVDDNRDAAHGMSVLLRAAGHLTRVEHDGLRAVQAATEYQPEIVLLDIGLPGLNGYAVAQRIRAAQFGAGCVIVAITGWGKEEDRRRALATGCDLHFTKPVPPRALIALLEGRPQHLCSLLPQRLVALHARTPGAGALYDSAVPPAARAADASHSLPPARIGPEPADAEFLRLAEHDLRRAVHGMAMLVEVMRVRLRDARAQAWLDRAQGCIEAAERLLQGLVALFKLEVGVIKPAAKEQAVADVFDALQSALDLYERPREPADGCAAPVTSHAQCA